MLHVLVISLVEHSWNKIKSDYGCPKKKRKDGMPKKHDPKKRRQKWGNHVSKKRERQGWFEREKPLPQGVSHIHPSIHPFIHLHLLIEIAWLCFSMDPLFDFTINRIQMCFILILPWTPQRLVVLGKIKGKHCPGKEIQDECLERVILELCHVFKKSFKKSVSRWIEDLWTSKHCFIYHSNSK